MQLWRKQFELILAVTLYASSNSIANQRKFCFLVIMFHTRPALSLTNHPPQFPNSPYEFFINHYHTRILIKEIIYMENIPGNLCTEPFPPICDSFQTEFNLLAKSSTSLHVKNKPCRHFRPQHYCTMPRENNEYMPSKQSKIKIEFHGLLYLTEY